MGAYHSQKKALKNSTMLDRVVSRFQAATISTQSTLTSGRDSDGNSTAEQGSVQMLFRLAGLERSNTNKERKERNEFKSDELEITENDGKFSFDCVNKILKWNAEAIGRVVELFPQSELAKDSFSILDVLFEYVFSVYLDTSLETLDEASAGASADVSLNPRPNHRLNSRLNPHFNFYPNTRWNLAGA
ncbi:hypothetical protein PCK1_000254 [Pneumocystis canis]|nr:hypothetical protein PCK1_000254 [Pneumocystis canis]